MNSQVDILKEKLAHRGLVDMEVLEPLWDEFIAARGQHRALAAPASVEELGKLRSELRTVPAGHPDREVFAQRVVEGEAYRSEWAARKKEIVKETEAALARAVKATREALEAVVERAGRRMNELVSSSPGCWYMPDLLPAELVRHYADAQWALAMLTEGVLYSTEPRRDTKPYRASLWLYIREEKDRAAARVRCGLAA